MVVSYAAVGKGLANDIAGEHTGPGANMGFGETGYVGFGTFSTAVDTEGHVRGWWMGWKERERLGPATVPLYSNGGTAHRLYCTTDSPFLV